MAAAAANAATDTALFNQNFVNQSHAANTFQSYQSGLNEQARTGLLNRPPSVQQVQGAAPGTGVISGSGLTPTLTQPVAPLTQVPVLDQNGVPTGRTAVYGRQPAAHRSQ